MSLPAYGTETLPDIANYQVDAEKSLRLYFSQDNPNFVAIFIGYKSSDVGEMLGNYSGPGHGMTAAGGAAMTSWMA